MVAWGLPRSLQMLGDLGTIQIPNFAMHKGLIVIQVWSKVFQDVGLFQSFQSCSVLVIVCNLGLRVGVLVGNCMKQHLTRSPTPHLAHQQIMLNQQTISSDPSDRPLHQGMQGVVKIHQVSGFVYTATFAHISMQYCFLSDRFLALQTDFCTACCQAVAECKYLSQRSGVKA